MKRFGEKRSCISVKGRSKKRLAVNEKRAIVLEAKLKDFLDA